MRTVPHAFEQPRPDLPQQAESSETEHRASSRRQIIRKIHAAAASAAKFTSESGNSRLKWELVGQSGSLAARGDQFAWVSSTAHSASPERTAVMISLCWSWEVEPFTESTWRYSARRRGLSRLQGGRG